MWRVLLYFFVAALAGLLLEVGDFQDVTSSGPRPAKSRVLARQ
jgi:hypothetical protein